MPAPIVIDTIRELIDHRYKLTAHCERRECRHTAVLDLAALCERLGPGHSTLKAALVPRLRCRRCGGKAIGITVAALTGYDRH